MLTRRASAQAREDRPGSPHLALALDAAAALSLGESVWRLWTDQEELVVAPFDRPAWAHTLGRDGAGLFAAADLKGITQRLRWIGPGRLLMGSPADEQDRFKDERQHEVCHTRGFWLAETACTQALWQAVMGDNPSGFNGERRPVDTVSWIDVQRFLERLNSAEPGLTARLPTEAEWEYACRAGTTTPFSFGEDIDPAQANYNGNYPYCGDTKGLYREQTVDVASLPANPWGLYEMHGNLWEWCQDWYGEYHAGPLTDPVGPPSGEGRVRRGGSWLRDGRDLRSASRFLSVPGNRRQFAGFRLVLGSQPRQE